MIFKKLLTSGNNRILVLLSIKSKKNCLFYFKSMAMGQIAIIETLPNIHTKKANSATKSGI